ncbi:MAG: hypothetical protein QXS20_06250 [Candidatus Thorarchaeota archaeon]
MELERALSKLKFDETVLGYALVTNDGQPFLSFNLPEAVFPQVAATVRTYSSTLRMMNVMTGSGTLVVARINPDWVLAVLFSEAQLGIALQKTREVAVILEQVDLPPPPTELMMTTSMSTSTATVELPQTEKTSSDVIEATREPVSTEEDQADIPIETIAVDHGCVVMRGRRYNEAILYGSPLFNELRSLTSPAVTDVLLLVDDKRTVAKISRELARDVEQVKDIIRVCASKRAVTLECPVAQVTGIREIVDCPLFEGDITKVKKEHRAVLELCDGTRTLQQISSSLGIQYFQALQIILQYKGKTLRLIRKDSEHA